MPATAINWDEIEVSREKGSYGVTIAADLMPALLEAAGCDNIKLPSCRKKVRDLILNNLSAAQRLPIVIHDDHVWFGHRGDDWYLTFFAHL